MQIRSVTRVHGRFLLRYASQLPSEVVESDRIRCAVGLCHMDVVGRHHRFASQRADWALQVLEQQVEDLGYFSNLFRRELPSYSSLSYTSSLRSATEELDRVALVAMA